MWTISLLARDGTAESISRDKILRRERGQGKNIPFSSSADHEQDWQPYPVDPYSAYIIHSYGTFNIHTHSIPIVGVGKRGAC